jgi:hypothetical protein
MAPPRQVFPASAGRAADQGARRTLQAGASDSAAPSPSSAAGPDTGDADPREHPLVKDVIELFQAKVIDVQKKS